MNLRPDYSRTCEECEFVVPEPWPKGKVALRCNAEGPRKGYVVGIDSRDLFIPAWCPRLIAEARAKEVTA